VQQRDRRDAVVTRNADGDDAGVVRGGWPRCCRGRVEALSNMHNPTDRKVGVRIPPGALFPRVMASRTIFR